MGHLGTKIPALIFALDAKAADPSTQRDELLITIAEGCAFIIEYFFRIHPYANGNGHIGRLIVWSLLARFGFDSNSMGANQKQGYGEALVDFRNKNRLPLIKVILRSMGERDLALVLDNSARFSRGVAMRGAAS
jgi:fido (protein-threonine AMPylation protein)